MKLLDLPGSPLAVHAPLPNVRRPLLPALALTAALLVAVSLAASELGKAGIPFDVQVRVIARRIGLLPGPVTWPSSSETILLEIRWPRVVLAGLVGAALAVAGAGYQGLFRNPLADPYLLGVASGAGLGAVIAFILPIPPELYGVGIVQLAAFVGALGTVVAVYALARVGQATPVTTLLLAGVAVGALASSATAYLMYVRGDKLLAIYSWLLGGFNVATWRQALLIAPAVVASAVAVSLCGRMLSVLQLGEEQAAALGVDVERLKVVLILASTLSTAAAVSAAGLIGFVGLIVPHTVRLLAGPDYRRLVPLAALGGAVVLIAADAAARGLLGPTEIPVGVVTAAGGAPFFLILLRRQKRGLF